LLSGGPPFLGIDLPSDHEPIGFVSHLGGFIDAIADDAGRRHGGTTTEGCVTAWDLGSDTAEVRATVARTADPTTRSRSSLGVLNDTTLCGTRE